MTDIFWALIHLCIFPGGIFALLVALYLKGLDRRFVARLQSRVGPPLNQPFIDIAKLMTKEQMIPKTACKPVFLLAPVIGLTGMAACAAFIPIPGVFDGMYNMGDLLVLFYLLPIPAIALMLGGSSSSSPFGAIGFSREMIVMLSYELPLLMVLLTVAMMVGRESGIGTADFSLLNIVKYQLANGSFWHNPIMVPAFVAYLMFLPGTMGVAPFDIAESETEILEGPMLEYGGPLLALFHIGTAFKTFVVLGLGVVMFMPGGITGFWPVDILIFLAKCILLMFFAMSLVRAATGRFRIDQAVKFYFKIPTALALVSLVLVIAL